MRIVVRRIHIFSSYFVTPSPSWCPRSLLAKTSPSFAWFALGNFILGSLEENAASLWSDAASMWVYFRPLWQGRLVYFFSMPFVEPLPGLVAQQKAESSPHALQLCLSSV